MSSSTQRREDAKPPRDYSYCFTEAEANRAFDEWGCNCGPTALAFVARVGLDVVRSAIPGFDEKRYTSPTMMKAALGGLAVGFVTIGCAPRGDESPVSVLLRLLDRQISLIRVQWTGPWTQPGMNPRWAYNFTHWIAGWYDGASYRVFDCNGGIRSLASWNTEIVPILTAAQNKRCDGGWYPTHVWRISQ